MDDSAKAIQRFVRNQAERQDRIDTEARAIAQSLIQKYIGSDNKIVAMRDFYPALVQALKTAREQGQED